MPEMEITVGDYGRAMFEMMMSYPKNNPNGYYDPPHWASIREKAEPLVRELLRLNEEMKPSGYRLIGYTDNTGKIHLPKHERAQLAQKQLWGVVADTLKIGDRVWLLDSDYDMQVDEQEPGVVEFINEHNVGVEISGFNHEFIARVGKKQTVIKAPSDWDDEDGNEKYDFTWWLEQADRLGI